MAQRSALSGPTGVVSARLLDKESIAFSYVHSHTRKEVYKESDHDGVQIVLRGTLIPKPQPRSTLQLDTEVRAAMTGLLTETTDLTVDTADDLWNRILEVGIEHQRQRAKARGARRVETLTRTKALRTISPCIARSRSPPSPTGS